MTSKMEVTADRDDSATEIRRGLSWEIPSGKRGLELARKVMAGTITAQEIVKALEPLGVWWGIESQYGGLSEYEAHAEGYDHSVSAKTLLAEHDEEKALAASLDRDVVGKDYAGMPWRSSFKAWQDYVDALKGDWSKGDGERWFGCSVPVILTAKRPLHRDGTPWDPEVHNPAELGGMMGNSYLPDHQPLEIVEVRYSPDYETYKVLRAGGIRTTASTANDPERWEEYLTPKWRSGGYGREVATQSFGKYVLHHYPDSADPGYGDIVTTFGDDVVATCYYGPWNTDPSSTSIEGAVQVHPGHRRKGIATAMYDWIEQITGKPMAPGVGHSSDAEAFWRRRRTTASAGTTIYRAEHRPPGEDLTHPASIGVHWTTRPIDYGYQHEPGWQRVVWHAVVDPADIEDATDRFGEGEVVVRNGGKVHLTGRTERLDRGYVAVRPEPEFPMDLVVPIKGRRIAKAAAAALDFRYDDFGGGEGRVVAWWTHISPQTNLNATGFITWNRQGKVSWVGTNNDEDRRKGVATALWHEAKRHRPDLHHSEEQSESGAAWARTTASLPGLTFEVHRDQHPTGRTTPGRTWITAHDGDKGVGLLCFWNTDHGENLGEIYDVSVAPSHRRRGIATEMLAKAREIEPAVHHSDRLTDDGKAWSQKVGAKTSLPSWRDRGVLPSVDCVIAPDLGRSSRNSYLVYLYDQPHARRPTLTEAKATVEEIYGPVDWQRIEGDSDEHHDHVWGWTTMFNDAPYYVVCERLPRLGATASLPDGLQIRYRTFEEGGRGFDDVGEVSAHLGGQQVGSLQWYIADDGLVAPGEVLMLEVDPDHQRKGIATALWEEARRRDSRVHHDTTLTGDGRAWMQSLSATASLSGPWLAEFARRWGATLTDPRLARDRCVEVSEDFAARAQQHGHRAEVVNGMEFGEVPEFPGVRMMLNGHFAVLVDGEVWDWTARQFDPQAPVPLVVPEAQWRQRWTKMGAHTASTEMVRYHGTSKASAADILANGARPGLNLTSNPNAARQFARYESGGTAWTKDKRKQGVVLEVRVRPEETKPGAYGDDHFVSGHVVTTVPIEPARIRVAPETATAALSQVGLEHGPEERSARVGAEASRGDVHRGDPRRGDVGPDHLGRDHHDRRDRGRAASAGSRPERVRPPLLVEAAFDNLVFEVTTSPSGEAKVIVALLDGQRVGTLRWSGHGTRYPEIQNVEVSPDHRRQGVATEMLRRAREITPNLGHSSDLSDDGRAWMQAVGSRGQVAVGGPLALVLHEYSPQRQQQIFAALKALRDGKVRPDAKDATRELKGCYTIPVGALSPSSTPDRLVLVRVTTGGWLAVFAVVNHNYQPAERAVLGWLRSKHAQNVRLGRLVRTAAGVMGPKEIYSRTDRIRDHVTKITFPQAHDLLRKVLTDAGFPQGAEAYADESTSQASSYIGWDLDTTPPIPVVFLHRRSMSQLVLLHEAAHLLWLGGFRGRNHGFDTEQVHDQRWFGIWTDLIHRYGDWSTRYEFDRTFGLVEDPEWEKASPLVMRASMAYYARDWRWQSWAKRNGGEHLLAKTPLPELRKMVQAVLDDHGVREPLDISLSAKGVGYSEAQIVDGRAYVLINVEEKNLWNALHEVSHIVCQHRGVNEPDDHGPGFQRQFSEVLEVYGGLDSVDLSTNPSSASVRRSASGSGSAGLRFVHLKDHYVEGLGDYPAASQRFFTPYADVLVAYDGSRAVGHIMWFTSPESLTQGGVDIVYVDPAYQRRGIATELLRRAKAIDPHVDPHNTPWFTDEGEAWVRSL